MSEDSQNNPPYVPLDRVRSALEQFRGRLFLSILVLPPGILSVPYSFRVLLVKLWFHFLVRGEPRKDEDGLDVKLFEDSQVRFDALHECQWRAPRRR